MIRNLDFVTVLSDAEIDFWKWLKRPIEIMPNFIPNIPTKTPNMESRNKKLFRWVEWILIKKDLID